MYKVYVITCMVDQSIYVGMTSQDLEYRLRGGGVSSHATQAKLGSCSKILGSKIIQYGIDSFTIEELYSTESKSECIEVEKYYICLAKWTGKSMNIMNGHNHDESTRARISDTVSSSPRCPSTSSCKSYNPELTRKRRSESITEKWKCGEYRYKQNLKKCKKVYCEETDTIYDSAQEASEELGVPYSTVKQACRTTGVLPKKWNSLHLKYKED